MRKAISLILIFSLCPVLLAEGNPNPSAEADSFKEIAVLRPLSLEQLVARAQPQQTQPNLHQNSTGPAFHAFDTAGGKTLTIIGGGLMTLGIILAATAGETVTINFTDPFSGTTTVIEASAVNNAQRWTGVGLAGAGGLLVWRGLSNSDN